MRYSIDNLAHEAGRAMDTYLLAIGSDGKWRSSDPEGGSYSPRITGPD